MNALRFKIRLLAETLRTLMKPFFWLGFYEYVSVPTENTVFFHYTHILIYLNNFWKRKNNDSEIIIITMIIIIIN